MTPSPSPLLEVKDLSVSFETEQGLVKAVRGVSFSVEDSVIHGIVGESGSGKSVAVRSLVDLLDDSATIQAESLRFDGVELLGKSEAELRSIRGSDIGMIFQNPAAYLNPVISVGEQIAEVARRHDPDIDESASTLAELKRKYLSGTHEDSESWQRAVELLGTVGLADPAARAREYPHQLSGGMKQRVMIAQVLAGKPSLIVADEPTTALDVSTEAQILRELVRLRDEFDISILLITHDMAVVSEVCDDVTVMYAGEVMETAPKRRLFEAPMHPYTTLLLESVPKLLETGGRLMEIEGDLPSPLESTPGCPFRERCPLAEAVCKEPLAQTGLGTDHTVRCHAFDGDSHHRIGAPTGENTEDTTSDD